MRSEVAEGSSGVGLVITNFGKFWVGFKKFQVVSGSLGWLMMVSDGFRLVACGFRRLRVVPDGCGWFAVSVVSM